jgi:putative phosphoesterase
MRAALIGDVHANLPALEAVLEHAQQQGSEALWNIGDFVGYGAYPNQVIDCLRREGALSVIGNYDLKVLKIKKKKAKWRNKRHPFKVLAFEWAYENLSLENKEYLASLPEEMRLEVEGKRILLTHASPASNEEILEPTTPEERLRTLAQMADVDLIIHGHSHRPFSRQVDGVWFINTGSVGRPDDGDPRAAYALLTISPDAIDVEHYRVVYDVERSVAKIREERLPLEFALMAQRGLSLDGVLGEE